MKRIDRYIFKEHVIPFLLSLLVLLFILLANFMLKKIDHFLGNGLGLDVLVEYLFYNMAWILARAVPMAVLIARSISQEHILEVSTGLAALIWHIWPIWLNWKGGKAVATELSVDEINICKEIGNNLRENGQIFVGIDVIGGKLTEINVTSPTGLQELEMFENKNFASKVWDKVISKIKL